MPGRDVPFLDVRQNLVSWLDRLVFPHHLYRDAPDHNVRDPEGLLSDLPAIGTALMGMLTGLWLRTRRPLAARTQGLAAAAVCSLALGYFWALWFPLNKNMWTSSYVLVAGGYSLVLLTLTFWAVEQKGWRTGWTWVWLVFGSNAIAAYMFSELLPGVLHNIYVTSEGRRMNVDAFVFTHVFAHIPDPGWSAFAYSVCFTAVCFIPVWMLYRRRIFFQDLGGIVAIPTLAAEDRGPIRQTYFSLMLDFCVQTFALADFSFVKSGIRRAFVTAVTVSTGQLPMAPDVTSHRTLALPGSLRSDECPTSTAPFRPAHAIQNGRSHSERTSRRRAFSWFRAGCLCAAVMSLPSPSTRKSTSLRIVTTRSARARTWQRRS